MLHRYIREYQEGFTFSFSNRIQQQLCGVNITIDVMMFEDNFNRRQKANILLEAGARRYEHLCVDVHNWEDMFYPIMLNGVQYLCFRKTLYGFTLLDTVTLEEKYDYFPTTVIDGKESFIITSAESRFDLLFFHGCYWADVDGTFVFDPATKQFVNLSKAVGLDRDHSEMYFDGDQLILLSDSLSPPFAQVALSQADIRRLIAKQGIADM